MTEANCPKCGGRMEVGETTASGLIGGEAQTRRSKLLFVVRGTPTSANPVQAFRQGLAEEAADRRYRIGGRRCAECGFLEFFGEAT